MTEFLTNVLMILLIVAAIVFFPMAIIWSLNTLFPSLAIPYTWQTWLAFTIIYGIILSFKKKV